MIEGKKVPDNESLATLNALDVKWKEVDLSLNSMVGLDSSKAMKLKGKIGDMWVIIPVDTCA